MDKKFYETPEMNTVELKLQGMICVSGFTGDDTESELGGGGGF